MFSYKCRLFNNRVKHVARLIHKGDKRESISKRKISVSVVWLHCPMIGGWRQFTCDALQVELHGYIREVLCASYSDYLVKTGSFELALKCILMDTMDYLYVSSLRDPDLYCLCIRTPMVEVNLSGEYHDSYYNFIVRLL